MDFTAIVAKTKKGEDEIQSRAHGLDKNLRFALILVDGKSTVQELIDGKGAGRADLADSIRQLAEAGFISVGGVSGEECEVTSGKDITTIKGELIAIAKEVLGSEAEKIVAKLEAAPDSREGLQEVVNSCKKVVKLLIDENKAEALMLRCGKVLQGL